MIVLLNLSKQVKDLQRRYFFKEDASTKDMRSPPFVEVIVLTHNNKKVLSDCLRSLAKTSYKNLQITIVDQCSNDGTSAFVKKRYPKFNLVRNNKNYSFAEANNRILKKSRAKYCILLNDDTIQDKKWVSNLVLVAENNADIAALQPKVRSLINKKKFDHAVLEEDL